MAREENPLRPDEQFFDAARLLPWLEENVPGFAGPFAVERFQGGQSNPTFRLNARSGRYVLRRKPAGALLPSAHAVNREFRVMRALAGTAVPVPPVHALCTDEAVIGSMFFVMDEVPGRVFWDPRLPEFPPEERTALYASLNETVAAIHGLDPVALGLGDYGRPGGFLARQVARWSQQYRAAETQPIPAMHRLMDWLPDHLPDEGETRLVHGDYRLDNVLIHPREPRVVAVLDWELSTLGDPLADFACHAACWHIPPALFRGLAGSDFWASGIPDEESYFGAYLARTGRARPGDWPFYLALGLFRFAAILQGIARRAIDGTASDRDARAVGAKAGPVADLAWSIVVNGRCG